MRPTIKEIAKMLDVSPSTVSYAINGGPRQINPETKERIMKLVRMLDYHPNANARTLVSKTTRSFGVVFPRQNRELVHNPFVAYVLEGAADCAEKMKWDLLLMHDSLDVMSIETALGTVIGGRVDALLFIAPNAESPILSELAKRHLPLAITNCDFKSEYANSVSVDNAHGVNQAMDYLFSLGHRDIGLISGSSTFSDALIREQVFMQRMREKGCQVPYDWVRGGDFDTIHGYEAAIEILKQKHRPTAIFAANDLMALGALKAAQALNINVPEQLSIIGFDDVPSAEWNQPRLTTVRQPMYEVGEQAMRFLVEQVAHHTLPRKTQLKTELIIRDSCAPPGK